MVCTHATYPKRRDAHHAARRAVAAALLGGRSLDYRVHRCVDCGTWTTGDPIERTSLRPGTCAVPAMRGFGSADAARHSARDLGIAAADVFRCRTCDKFHYTAPVDDNAPGDCPHDSDMPAFCTLAEALSLRDRLPWPTQWEPHTCRCGRWHLTPPRRHTQMSWEEAKKAKGCPTPDKYALSTLSAARKRAKMLGRDPATRGHGFWGPYLCTCGDWHVAAYDSPTKAAEDLTRSKAAGATGTRRAGHGGAKNRSSKASTRPAGGRRSRALVDRRAQPHP